MRFFPNNTNTPLASSATITVAPPTIALSATSVLPGVVVTATIANGPGNATDWVGLARTSDSIWLDWRYLNGSRTPPANGLTGATVAFTMPATPGTYNLRFLPNNTNTPLMTSATITVTSE